ncbi:LOW QUALITY PROTEIN: hypothetical protein PHMEG_0008371 [Phytophthora megakarya]|uniref:Uncharacterized protein n=1 Tax=Phytophthora megakarya TaxID=4795 RepID=A0A225WLD7_9STRA|nr:LOW QUALITY PROTEIN: hypothetical protein PHMEG_0008371 [Phytophthora megakarya]
MIAQLVHGADFVDDCDNYGGRFPGTPKPYTQTNFDHLITQASASGMEAGQLEELSVAEKKAFKSLETQQRQAKKCKQQDDDYTDSLLHSGEQQRKHGRLSTRYDDIVVKISPMSNEVERLFSRCKLILSQVGILKCGKRHLEQDQRHLSRTRPKAE